MTETYGRETAQCHACLWTALMARSAPRRPIAQVPRFLLTRKEAADSLGMSVDTFERRVQPLLRVVHSGQLVLVPPSELERWVEENARFSQAVSH